MSLLHVTGEKDDSLQCTTKVNTKFGTKTVTKMSNEVMSLNTAIHIFQLDLLLHSV